MLYAMASQPFNLSSKYMSRHLLIVLTMLSLFACNQHSERKKESEENSYLFDGKIKGMDSGSIFIGHPDTTGKNFSYLDSSKIVNGSFKFSGTVSNAEPCIFVFKNGENSLHLTSNFILDKGHTTGILYKDSIEKSIITGTNSQNQFQNFIFL